MYMYKLLSVACNGHLYYVIPVLSPFIIVLSKSNTFSSVLNHSKYILEENIITSWGRFRISRKGVHEMK